MLKSKYKFKGELNKTPLRLQPTTNNFGEYKIRGRRKTVSTLTPSMINLGVDVDYHKH